MLQQNSPWHLEREGENSHANAFFLNTQPIFIGTCEVSDSVMRWRQVMHKIKTAEVF